MGNGSMQWWFYILCSMLILLKTESQNVPITILDKAVEKGAVCLDGSPPAYYLDRGIDSEENNWIVHMEGGAWCNNVTDCQNRAKTFLGSSKHMPKVVSFRGLASNKPWINPAFFSWNRVFVMYCDGASYTGNVEEVDPATNLHFRGARIFPAVMEDLESKGMRFADNVILSGCSAGGLTVMLHCDAFRSRLKYSRVKCLSDAGYFINIKDVSDKPTIENFFDEVATLHGSEKSLPEKCTSKMKPNLCFFPQNFAKYIRTPLFLVNAAYDSWQIQNVLVPDSADPDGLWNDCKKNFTLCSTSQLQILQDFRYKFLIAFKGIGTCSPKGYFINSCYVHCQTENDKTWFGIDSPQLGGQTIAYAVRDWFYEIGPIFQHIDCPYPCDNTCITDNLRGSPKGNQSALAAA